MKRCKDKTCCNRISKRTKSFLQINPENEMPETTKPVSEKTLSRL